MIDKLKKSSVISFSSDQI